MQERSLGLEAIFVFPTLRHQRLGMVRQHGLAPSVASESRSLITHEAAAVVRMLSSLAGNHSRLALACFAYSRRNHV